MDERNSEWFLRIFISKQQQKSLSMALLLKSFKIYLVYFVFNWQVLFIIALEMLRRSDLSTKFELILLTCFCNFNEHFLCGWKYTNT